MLKHVSEFSIDSFTGRQGLRNGNAPAILLEDVSDGIIRESRALADTHTFIHVAGSGSREITLRNNHTRNAKEEISFGSKNLSKAVVREK